MVGALGYIVARTEIGVKDEIYVNYEYNLKVAPKWYREEYELVYGFEE